MKRIWILFSITLILLLFIINYRGPASFVDFSDSEDEVASSSQRQASGSAMEEVAPKICFPETGSSLSNRMVRVMTLKDVPAGNFKRELENLPAAVRKRVLLTLEESPQLLNDINSIRVDDEGMIYYVCKLEMNRLAWDAEPTASAEIVSMDEPVFNGPVSNSTPPVFHSRLGSSKVLFLDFNGHEISGTKWNLNANYPMPETWVCLPYDTDGDILEFSVAEQQIIYEVWLRVSEDYAPFDVDVTTEEPAVWTQTTGHALITPRTDANGVDCPHAGYGGIAYRNVFGLYRYSYNEQPCYSPAWVRDYTDAGDVAEVISHELGHNLSLSHDGDTTGDEYYDGHQNGSMSWGAIMGTAYDENLSQWSKGEYYRANNSEDDLAMISGKLGYIADDYGDSSGSATAVTIGTGSTFSITGRVERTDDSDVFSVAISSNVLLQVFIHTLRLDANTRGSNLDALLELRDSSDLLISSNNYELEVSAGIEAELAPGTYYLYVKPVGTGSPLSNPPTGYTSYGSLGSYVLEGTLGMLSTNAGFEPPVTGSFESDFDAWGQSTVDDMDWTRNQYTPTTLTGPKDGADSTYFIFTEASNNNQYRIVNLERTFDFSSFETAALEFKYHMYGEDMGSLSVDVFNGKWNENIWKRIGEQHTSETQAWSTATVDLTDFTSQSGVKIRFRGIVGSGFYSDMAIDSVSITGVLNLDIDGDGIPNEWEELYFGGATNADASAMASNGVNTLLETYVAGLNPTNPASVFELSSLRNIIGWNAVTGRVYSIYWTSNLLSGFQVLETNFTGGGFTDTVHDVDQKGFYRIEVKLAP